MAADDGEPLVNFPDANGKTRFTILSAPDGSYRVKTPDGSLRQFPPGMSWQEIGEQFSNALDAAQPDVGKDVLNAAKSAAVTGPMSALSIPGDIEGWMKSGGINATIDALTGGSNNADPRAAAIAQGPYTKVMPGGAQTAVDPAKDYPAQTPGPDVSSPIGFNGKTFPSFDDLMAIYNGQNVPNRQPKIAQGPDGAWHVEQGAPREPFVPYEPQTWQGRATNMIVGAATGAGTMGLLGGPRAIAATVPRAAGQSAAEAGLAGALRQGGSTALWQGVVPGAAMWGTDEALMNSDPRIRAGLDTVAGLAAGMYPKHWLTPHPSRPDIPVQPGSSGTVINPPTDPVFSPQFPKRNTDAQILQDAGVNLTAGQRTGYQALAFRESEGGGQAFQDAIDRQRQEFTRETLRRANILDDNGNVPTRFTPETLRASMNRTGNEINRLAQYDLELRIPEVQRVWQGLNDYIDSTAPSMRVPSVTNMADDVIQPVLDAIMGNNQSFANYSGEKYRNVRSQLSRMADSMKNSNPPAAEALRGIQHVLDDAMERAIAANAPDDIGAWQAARRQYQSQLIVQSAADKGQAGAAGFILPTSLQAAVKSVQGQPAYSRGLSQFDDLARAGSDLMTTPPNSGTSARQKVSNLAYNLAPVALAGGLAGYGTNPTSAPDHYAAGGGAVAALAAAMIAPRIFNRTIMSRPVQGYLANQTFLPSPSGPSVASRMALLHSITMPERFPLPVQAPDRTP